MDQTIRAAGVVLWREASDEVSVALVHRPKYDDWTLPKGKLDPGETDLEAARRETFEETGYTGEIGQELGHVRYSVTDDDGVYDKVVVYWAMRADEGRFTPTEEVDELRWVALADAFGALTYDRDREVLHRFVAAAP